MGSDAGATSLDCTTKAERRKMPHNITGRILQRPSRKRIGAASMPDLRIRIEDKGSPILLPSPAPVRTLHVYEGGYLTLGPESLQEPERPTWREVLRLPTLLHTAS